MAFGDLSGILTPKPQGSYATPRPKKSPNLSKVYSQNPSAVSYTLNGVNYNYAGIPLSSGGSSSSGDTSRVSGASTYDPVAAQRAAEEAAAEARRQQVIGETTGLVKNLLGLYDSLAGNVRGAAKSQNELLDKRYNTEVGGLTDQFNQELPKIGRAYAARGTYDSSYRDDSEQQATKGFENQISDISTQREADAAKIGQYVAEQEAKVNAEKGLLNRSLAEIPNITDIDELTALKRQIDRQIADVDAARASNQSQGAYIQKLSTLAPAADRMGQLQSTLSNLISGAAPAPLKRAVAQQIIGSSGLDKKQQDELLGQVNSQIV